MKLKNIFLLLAVISVIMISTPQIYSLFVGQHNWYDITPSGTQISCDKCHSNVRQEISVSSVMGSSMGFDCTTCHVNVSVDESGHHGNVVKPRCLDCHSYIGTKLSNDAHRFFIAGASSSGVHKGENEACISCHTKKSLNAKFTFADIYKVDAIRELSGTWQVSGSKAMESGIVSNILYNDPNKPGTGQHQFVGKTGVICEKCHSDIRSQLNTSVHYQKPCKDCHFKDPESTYVHAAALPKCLDCHSYIFNSTNNMINRNVEAHMPLIDFGIGTGEYKNIACSSCHSTFRDDLSFTRPEYLEWDVVNHNDTNWTIENFTVGPTKNVPTKKIVDNKLHNITRNINCPLCHSDIREAASKGGHTNEQWQKKHNINDYSSTITYCRSCHKPMVNVAGYENHGGMRISCLDCHTKNIEVDIRMDGGMKQPPWDSGKMGYIQLSIAKLNKNFHSYICMACKNTGVPKPEQNKSLHFKMYTEPDVRVYLNGAQKYP